MSSLAVLPSKILLFAVLVCCGTAPYCPHRGGNLLLLGSTKKTPSTEEFESLETPVARMFL